MEPHEMEAAVAAATNLRELCDALNMIEDVPHELRELVDIDYAKLPTFGGACPNYSEGVWSYDAHNVIVNDTKRPPRVTILSRADYCGETA